ncbi:predicted protein [Naegleria gruberi]|uniref:Predicted protein n=1 Tax=Naegleria gruberi TaxID=5762 RepID=D2VIK9_NAEGR|nr:uncharacterized protein NAEGRDRAFT_49837 [Naegleria gruberi]EFC43374.1 predicted protein [Naegleria gruberi]|eukprot:XP_002676118.1 predicted protein [Naegleria gruberi strain NEG-M]
MITDSVAESTPSVERTNDISAPQLTNTTEVNQNNEYLDPKHCMRGRENSITAEDSSQNTDCSLDSMDDNDDSVVAIDEIMYGNTMKPTPFIDSLKRKGRTGAKEINEKDIANETCSQGTDSNHNSQEPSFLAIILFGTLVLFGKFLNKIESTKFSVFCCCFCLPTRYRDVKFGLVSLLSVMALVLNIVVLMAIAAVTILQYFYVSQVPVAQLLTNRATAISSYNDMKTAVRLGAFNRGSVQAKYPLELFRNGKTSFTNSLTNILNNIPSIETEYMYLNGSRDPNSIYSLDVLRVWELTMNLTFNGTNMDWGNKFTNETHRDGDRNQGGTKPPGGGGGGGTKPPGGGGGPKNGTKNDQQQLPSVTNQLVAQFYMNSSDFVNAEMADGVLFRDFLDRLFNESIYATDIGFYSNVTSLALLGLSILIVIPLVIIIFGISLKTSQQNQKKLQQVNAAMVLDTLKDPTQKQRFKQYCSNSSELEVSFLFLDLVSEYKEVSSQSVQVQVDLFEKSKQYLTLEKNRDSIKNQPSETEIHSIRKSEKKLKKIEKEKQNLVFEIWSQFLEPYTEIRTILSRVSVSDVELLVKEIDSFNNQLEEYQYFDILPDDLFNEVERQIAKSLSEDHLKFQNMDPNQQIIAANNISEDDGIENITKEEALQDDISPRVSVAIPIEQV